MATCVMMLLQNKIKEFMNVMKQLNREAEDIYEVYWDTDVNTNIGGLQDTDAATVNSKITKAEYVNGITISEQIKKFFANLAVTQGDYLSYCRNIQYGNDARVSKLSEAVEGVGDRLYQVSVNCISYYKTARDILDIYTGNEVADLIANLDEQRLVPGSDLTKSDLSLGITLIEQFKKMMNNEVVTQADYASTLAKWERII